MINKQEYAKKMRLALSDKNICKSDGTVNHQYFLVKKGQYWGEDQEKQLIEEVQHSGVGNWKQMQRNNLSNVSEMELELRTCLLFKTTDISPYQDKKYTIQEIESIGSQNLEKAQQNNKLKYGIYIQ